MKPLFLLALLALPISLLYGQKPPVDCKNSPMFIFSEFGSSNSSLHTVTIDSVAGIALLDALPQPSGIAINAIGYRLQDKMVYGCEGNRLVRIDGSGEKEILHTMSLGSFAGDVTPDGHYLVLANFDEFVFIDLESGAYEEKKLPLILPIGISTLATLDIAFNPVSGLLYAFDVGVRKLVTVDLHTGLVNYSQFASNGVAAGFAALFFDSYGNLWGSSSEDGINKYLYQLSTFNGQVITKLPVIYDTEGSVDGCSCPGSFNFQKTAYPERVSHCGELDFIFTVSNRTGQTQSGIQLEDAMPSGITIEKIVRNPFSGQVLSGPGSDYLLVDSMTVPVGVDSVIVRVQVDSLLSGEYKNQAWLKNVRIRSTQPENLVSDDPRTHFRFDSTVFSVQDLQSTLSPETRHICPGETAILDASVPGAKQYVWENDSKSATLEVKAAGLYVVEIQTSCEAGLDTFLVEEEGLTLDLGADTTIQIGDTLEIKPNITNPGQYLHRFWWSEPLTTPFCKDCVHQTIFPFQPTTYTLELYNEYGCTAADDIKIAVLRSIYVPNVFSPNGDGENDVFFIQTKNPLLLSYWQIFDRWGSLVFARQQVASNDPAQGWDPLRQNRSLAAGVYTWIAELVYPDGRTEALRGDVTIVR